MRSPANGARYADLDNAFVYRERILDNCTCNGRNSFGLAPIDAASDPTLRPGDIVASGDNVKAALIAAAAAKERVTAREAAERAPGIARFSRVAAAAAAPAPSGSASGRLILTKAARPHPRRSRAPR